MGYEQIDGPRGLVRIVLNWRLPRFVVALEQRSCGFPEGLLDRAFYARVERCSRLNGFELRALAVVLAPPIFKAR
jgi:hypothetical protein